MDSKCPSFVGGITFQSTSVGFDIEPNFLFKTIKIKRASNIKQKFILTCPLPSVDLAKGNSFTRDMASSCITFGLGFDSLLELSNH